MVRYVDACIKYRRTVTVCLSFFFFQTVKLPLSAQRLEISSGMVIYNFLNVKKSIHILTSTLCHVACIYSLALDQRPSMMASEVTHSGLIQVIHVH